MCFTCSASFISRRDTHRYPSASPSCNETQKGHRALGHTSRPSLLPAHGVFPPWLTLLTFLWGTYCHLPMCLCMWSDCWFIICPAHTWALSRKGWVNNGLWIKPVWRRAYFQIGFYWNTLLPDGYVLSLLAFILSREMRGAELATEPTQPPTPKCPIWPLLERSDNPGSGISAKGKQEFQPLELRLHPLLEQPLNKRGNQWICLINN